MLFYIAPLMIKRDTMRPTLSNTVVISLLAAFCAVAGPDASAAPSQGPVVHHDLIVTLDPANHRLKVRDRIRVPAALVTAPLTISLNADLNVHAVSGGLQLLVTERNHTSVSAFPDMAVKSACASSFSRFARRSLALRPAPSRCHQF